MNRGIGAALLAVGVALLIFGLQASDSLGSDISKFFTGNPTDKSMWLLIGGVAALVAGAVMALKPSKA